MNENIKHQCCVLINQLGFILWLESNCRNDVPFCEETVFFWRLGDTHQIFVHPLAVKPMGLALYSSAWPTWDVPGLLLDVFMAGNWSRHGPIEIVNFYPWKMGGFFPSFFVYQRLQLWLPEDISQYIIPVLSIFCPRKFPTLGLLVKLINQPGLVLAY